MNFLKTVALAAALVTFGLSAQAANYTLTPDLSSPGSYSFGLGTDFGVGVQLNGAFDDNVSFTLSPLSPTTEDITFVSEIKTGSIPDLAVTISGGTYSNAAFTNLVWSGILTPGTTYTLNFTGTATAGSNATYAFNTQLQPVPEPQSIALMLAGLGAVGFIAKRRAR